MLSDVTMEEMLRWKQANSSTFGIKHVQSKDFSVYTHQNHYVTEIS